MIRKLTLLAVTAFLGVHLCHAQIVKEDTLTHWKKAFRTGLNLNQASFSSNWKAGGVNSIGFNALLNYKANYKKDINSWDNEIDLLYGMVNNQGQGYRKTLDRIFLDTRYGRSLTKKWDLSLAANLLSQFANGYKYGSDPTTGAERDTLISSSFAPTYVTATLGMEYHPVEYFKVRLSPLAPRATIVNNVDRFVTKTNPTPYGVSPGKMTRFEWYAFQMLTEFNKDIIKNTNLKFRYIMFVNYQTLEWKKVNHRLDLNITSKISKFINVSIGSILLYDYKQDAKVQFSQAFSLGVLYSFQNYKDKK